jgi:hypothetical protein
MDAGTSLTNLGLGIVKGPCSPEANEALDLEDLKEANDRGQTELYALCTEDRIWYQAKD